MGKPWVNYHLELQLLQVTEYRPVILYDKHYTLDSHLPIHFILVSHWPICCKLDSLADLFDIALLLAVPFHTWSRIAVPFYNGFSFADPFYTGLSLSDLFYIGLNIARCNNLTGFTCKKIIPFFKLCFKSYRTSKKFCLIFIG